MYVLSGVQGAGTQYKRGVSSEIGGRPAEYVSETERD